MIKVLQGLLGSGAQNNTIQLVKFLGYTNVFVDGVPWSFSQQGDITFAEWDVVGVSINVIGPRGAGKLVKRFWDIHNRMIICFFNSQSNDVGAQSNQSGVLDPTVPFMQLPPVPAILKAFTGGFTPTQGGVNPPTVGEFIDPAQIAGLVPGAENINTGRVGSPVNRQMWSSMFGQVIAASVPNDNIVVVANTGHGGTSFSEDVQGAAFFANMTWSVGIGLLTFTGFTGTPVGSTITVVNGGGYNGTYRVLTSDGTTVGVSIPANPGAFVPGAYALVPKAPTVNQYTMLNRLVSTIAPALNLSPYAAVYGYNGNEADDTLATVANALNQNAVLRQIADDFEQICGQSERMRIMRPEVGYPVSSWQNTDLSLFNCASNVALGALETALTPGQYSITNPQYSSDEAAFAPCIHYSVQGHSDNGERPANLFLDDVTGDADPSPTRILVGEEILYRVLDSNIIHGVYSRTAVIDTAGGISDPGNHGFQAYAGVMGVAGADGGNGFEVSVSGVTVAGTTLTLTLTAPPATAWGNYVGYAYNNSLTTTQPNRDSFSNVTWAATGGGQATYTTVSPHGLNPGGEVTTIGNDPDGYDIVPGVPCLAGTTGSTIIMPLAVDPGPIVTPGNLAINGEHGVGNTDGLRGQVRADTIDHYSNNTGFPLPRWAPIQFAPVDTFPSSKSIVTMLTECGLTSAFQLVMDFGNSGCYGGSGNGVTNLGTSTTTDDYWRGLSGVDTTRTPTFNGTPGSLDRTCYFSADADGKIFTPQTVTDVLTDAHMAGGQGTVIVGVLVPSTGFTNNLYEISTAKFEGGSQGPGVAIRVGNSTRRCSLVVHGDGGSSVASQTTDLALPADVPSLFAYSWEDSNPDSYSYVWDGSATTTAAGFQTDFNPQYASPSVNPAQSDAYLWQDGATGTVRANAGCRYYFLLVSNSFIPQQQILPLLRGLFRRQARNLP